MSMKDHYFDQEISEMAVSKDPGLTPRGKMMPQTPEEFAYMGGLYEAGALKMQEEIGQLKHKINTLTQRLERYERENRIRDEMNGKV